MSNSADKRSVSTDALETLGTIIDDSQKRDAIHLAVLPVIAAQVLSPGDHVNEQGEVVRTGTGLGIVDPFLKDNVLPGERFWLVIYPRVITSLRHVWTHPALPDESTGQAPLFNKEDSERWLREFIAGATYADYEEVIAAALDSEGSEYVMISGSDASGLIPTEFWYHLSVVSGRAVRGTANYFSCSC